MAAATMTEAARRELHVAALTLGFNPDGFDHYMTSVGDDGVSAFAYDHEDGRALRVRVTAEGRTYDMWPTHKAGGPLLTTTIERS